MKVVFLLFSALLITKSKALRLLNKRDVEEHAVKHWGYRNEDKSLLPKNWHKNHPKCYGKQQSPINIEPSLTTFDEKLEELNYKSSFLNSTDDNEVWTVKNNGHSGKIFILFI